MHDESKRHDDVKRVLADVIRLQRHRIARDGRGQFWIEGVRQFLWAVEAGFEINRIVHCPLLLKNGATEKLIRRLVGQREAARTKVSAEEFRTVCMREHASGIGAIVRQEWTPIFKASPFHGLCWLAIERVRSPGNLGTILRTAEAAGVTGVMFLGTACDPFEPAVVNASMGGLFHLKMVRCSIGELRRWADERGVKLVGMAPRAERLWVEMPMPEPVVLMIGEERQGLSQEAMAACDMLVRLPMRGRADSINVAVAAGVGIFELVRKAGVLGAG